MPVLRKRESKEDTMLSVWGRAASVGVLLGLCGLFLYLRPAGNGPRRSAPLVDFPLQFQGWRGSANHISPGVLAVLGPGEYLDRSYRRSGMIIPVGLFVAYFPSQRTGDTIHSPQDCLPGSGWTPLSSRRVSLSGHGLGALTVNRYVIAKGLDRMLVLYWYEEQGRDVASEYLAKVFLVADSIGEERTDGALIRVSVPIVSREDAGDAQNSAVAFMRDMLPVLREYVGR